MARLTGQAALDYMRKNPNANYDVYDGDKLVESKTKDEGFLGNLLSGITKPFTDFDKLLGTYGEMTSNDRKSLNETSFLTSDQKRRLAENPGAFVGQKALGVGSSLLPFGGGAKALMAAGGLNALSQTDYEKGAGEVLNDVGLGSVGGLALGKLVPFVGKGVKGVASKFAPKLEQEGAETVTKSLTSGLQKAFDTAEGSFEKGVGKRAKNFTQGLRGAELDVSTAAGVNNPVLLKRQTQNVLDTLGEPQDINGIVRGKQKVGDLMDTYVDEVYSKNPKLKVTGDELFGDNFQDEINSIAIGTGATPEQINSFAKTLIGQGKYGEFKDIVTKQFSPGDLTQILKDVNGALRNKDITGVRRLYAEEVKKAIYSKLADVAPEYKPIARAYAVLAQNEKDTALLAMKGEKSASQSGFLGLQNVLPINQLKNKVARAAGNVLEKGIPKVSLPKSQAVASNLTKLSDFLQKQGLPQTKVAQLVGSQAMLEMFDADGDGQLNEQESMNAEQSGLPEYDTTEMGFDPSELGYPEDMTTDPRQQEIGSLRQQLIAQEMSKTDKNGKRIYNAKEAADFVDSQFAAQGIDTSSFSKKDQDGDTPAKIKEQYAALNTSRKQLEKLNSEAQKFTSGIPIVGGLLGMNPFDSKRQGFTSRLKATMQNVAKSMEGGKLTDADREYYNSFLPNDRDTAESFKEKVAAILDMVNVKQQELEGQF